MNIYEHYWDAISTEKAALSTSHEEGKAEGEAIGLAEGEAIGLAEGEAIGLAKGKAEGLTEGKAKGKAEGLAKWPSVVLKEVCRWKKLPN
jgi:flagellar biosynthesis/type III secretory pathway protein FliH